MKPLHQLSFGTKYARIVEGISEFLGRSGFCLENEVHDLDDSEHRNLSRKIFQRLSYVTENVTNFGGSL